MTFMMRPREGFGWIVQVSWHQSTWPSDSIGGYAVLAKTHMDDYGALFSAPPNDWWLSDVDDIKFGWGVRDSGICYTPEMQR